MTTAHDEVSVKALSDNYGRWFVEVTVAGRRQAPIRCMSEAEAADRVRREQSRLAEGGSCVLAA